MGGAIAEEHDPSAEFNIWIDPEAAAHVFASGLDVTMVGLDVTNRRFTPAHADQLRPQGPVGEAVAAMLDFYGASTREAYDHGGCPVHERWPFAHVARPELVSTLGRHGAEVDVSDGICRGRTVVDMRHRTASRAA